MGFAEHDPRPPQYRALYLALDVPTQRGITALTLHDALPSFRPVAWDVLSLAWEEEVGQAERDQDQQDRARPGLLLRSEEHTSELQSHLNLVCRLLLEKKTSIDW